MRQRFAERLRLGRARKVPLKSYGVLKGRPIEVRLATSQNAHYHVHLVDNTTDYRIAINVASAVYPSEVEYIVIDKFEHPLVERVSPLPLGYSTLAPQPTSSALDFIRGNLFDRTAMRPLPFNCAGPDNDLNEKIDAVMQRALGDEEALVYAFGERWGPEVDLKDKFFGFLPGNGIHDIHMNQGNVGKYTQDDGVWQDGGLLVNFPTQNQWTAVFLRFQSQAWHTDDQTGHSLIPAATAPTEVTPTSPRLELPTEDEPQGLVRIVGALVNDVNSPELETVTLLNTSPRDVDLTNWAIADTQKLKGPVSGKLAAGATIIVPVTPPAALSNKGGVITLLNDKGLKVDGVSYTKAQARHPGWTIVF